MLSITTASSKERIEFQKNQTLKIASFLFFCVWCWTLIDVADMMNWTLENTPVFLLIGILLFTYKKFQFSDLSYILIFIFLSLHIYGAKFIYAENPLGFWLQEQFNSDRNHYDRIVHFLFGIMLSYPIRELCLRYFNFSNKISLGISVISCLALSAFYEIVEGAVAVIFFPEQGVNFLGIQGDQRDPQKDMFLAFFGSICFVIVISIVKSIKRY